MMTLNRRRFMFGEYDTGAEKGGGAAAHSIIPVGLRLNYTTD